MMASLVYRQRKDKHFSPCTGTMKFRDEWQSQDRSCGIQSHRSASWLRGPTNSLAQHLQTWGGGGMAQAT